MRDAPVVADDADAIGVVLPARVRGARRVPDHCRRAGSTHSAVNGKHLMVSSAEASDALVAARELANIKPRPAQADQNQPAEPEISPAALTA